MAENPPILPHKLFELKLQERKGPIQAIKFRSAACDAIYLPQGHGKTATLEITILSASTAAGNESSGWTLPRAPPTTASFDCQCWRHPHLHPVRFLHQQEPLPPACAAIASPQKLAALGMNLAVQFLLWVGELSRY